MHSNKPEAHFLSAIRQASPYIQQHSGKTIVCHLMGELWQSTDMQDFIQDLILCNCLGIKLVLVIGGRPQITDQLRAEQQNASLEFHRHHRVTHPDSIGVIQQVIADLIQQLHVSLAQAQANNLVVQDYRLPTVVSGNWLMAHPIGVLDGVDYLLTGKVSGVQTAAITANLDKNHIVIVPPIGFGVTGEVFNLDSRSVSIKVAERLAADKLILFDDADVLAQLPNQIHPKELETIDCSAELKHWLGECRQILTQVPRIHFLSMQEPTQLLQELFTRDGSGVLLYHSVYGELKPAKQTDINAILALISPYVYQGALTSKPYDFINQHIDNFVVAKRDGLLTACVGMMTYENNTMELLALAVNPDYVKLGVAGSLFQYVRDKAEAQNINTLFALTTQASHWFVKKGFQRTDLHALPPSKQQQLDTSRNSHVYTLALG